jgi:hypothetical protein
MNSAIALFFASLVSGVLSFADFRPALSDMVQILTGVELAPSDKAATKNTQNSTDHKLQLPQQEKGRNCQARLLTDPDGKRPSCQLRSCQA